MTRKYALAVSLFLLCIALTVLIIPAFYARFMADDYCMNAGAKSASFLVFFKSVYINWSGRFAYIASTYYLSRIPPQAFGILATMIVLFWVCTLASAIKAGGKLFNLKLDWAEGFTLSVIFLLALFKTAPNLYQDLYWRDGLVNYIVPLVFSSLSFMLVANIFQTKLTLVKGLFLGMVAFFSAGFSESASVANLVFWTTICLFLLFIDHPQKKALIITLAIPAFAAFFGFLIEFFAPGNLVRSSLLPYKLGIFELVGLTLRNVAHLYGRLLIYGLPWVLICLLVSLGLGITVGSRSVLIKTKSDQSHIRAWLIGAALVNVLLGSGVCAAVAYLMKAYPDDRIILIPYFYALLTVLITGLIIGRGLGLHSTPNNMKITSKMNSIAPSMLLTLAIVLASLFTVKLINTLPALTNYAHRWDARDAFIRAELAAGKQDLLIPGLESRYGLPDLQLEKEDWVNNCTAGYYGARSITGK
jgi:hypothetical protein